MAEDPSPPPAEASPTVDWRKAILDLIHEDAAEALRRRQEEGSTVQQDFGLPQENTWPPKVRYKFAQGSNTTPGRSFHEGVQSGFQASPPVVQSPNAHCRQLGHQWKHNGLVDSGRVEEWVCERCNMTRHSTVSWGQMKQTLAAPVEPILTKEQAAKILGKMAPVIPKPEVGWICFYCGDEFVDEEGLLDHEDLCAEEA
jgi:hypothetical protein